MDRDPLFAWYDYTVGIRRSRDTEAALLRHPILWHKVEHVWRLFIKFSEPYTSKHRDLVAEWILSQIVDYVMLCEVLEGEPDENESVDGLV